MYPWIDIYRSTNCKTRCKHSSLSMVKAPRVGGGHPTISYATRALLGIDSTSVHIHPFYSPTTQVLRPWVSYEFSTVIRTDGSGGKEKDLLQPSQVTQHLLTVLAPRCLTLPAIHS